MKELTGGYWLGVTNYRKNIIYIRKDLSPKVKRETILHEKGHFRFRKRKPYIGKKLKKELKSSPLYKSYKKEYTTKKISEEMLVQLNAEKCKYNRKGICYLKKKYPHTMNKIKQTFN